MTSAGVRSAAKGADPSAAGNPSAMGTRGATAALRQSWVLVPGAVAHGREPRAISGSLDVVMDAAARDPSVCAVSTRGAAFQRLEPRAKWYVATEPGRGMLVRGDLAREVLASPSSKQPLPTTAAASADDASEHNDASYPSNDDGSETDDPLDDVDTVIDAYRDRLNELEVPWRERERRLDWLVECMSHFFGATAKVRFAREARLHATRAGDASRQEIAESAGLLPTSNQTAVGCTPDSTCAAESPNLVPSEANEADGADSGFRFFAGLDSPGFDVGGAPTSDIVWHLLAAARADGAVAGFNSNGFLKSRVRPRAEWTKWTSDSQLGLYVRAEIAPPGGRVVLADGQLASKHGKRDDLGMLAVIAVHGPVATPGPVAAAAPASLDLRTVRVLYLNRACDERRRAHMESMCGALFARYARIEGPDAKKLGLPGTAGCGLGHARSVDAALVASDAFEPFLVLEDDVSAYAGAGASLPELRYPADADAVYLGVSTAGAMRGTLNSCQAPVQRRRCATHPHLVHVFNMLGTHAILFLTRAFALAYMRAMVEGAALAGAAVSGAAAAGSPNTATVHVDQLACRLQTRFRVYALTRPLFYQDAKFGGQETDTRVDWTHAPDTLPRSVLAAWLHDRDAVHFYTDARPSDLALAARTMTS